MKKQLLMVSLAIFASVGLVLAGGYIVHNFVLVSDVYEPFSVQYAIIGDAGNWDGVTTCGDYEGEWTSYPEGVEVDVAGLYVGEGRMVCAKITNLAEADISYTISNTITNEDPDAYALCSSAFGENTLSGTAIAQSDTVDGMAVVVAEDATPVNDCKIQINVARG